MSKEFWSDLIDLNKHVDGLFEKCLKAIETTRPIGREIPFYASLEARFEHLPRHYQQVAAPNSDALAGNNIKRVVFTNFGSRVYVREIGFQPMMGIQSLPPAPPGVVNSNGRSTAGYIGRFPFNWRWNFQTSITQRQYADRRVLAKAGGLARAGNHLAFRKPLIIEPMETLTYECELVGGAGMTATGDQPPFFFEDIAVISMEISGYREGV